MSNYWISMDEVSKAAETMTPEDKARQRWGVTGLLHGTAEDRQMDLAILLENQQRWTEKRCHVAFATLSISLVGRLFREAEKTGLKVTSKLNPTDTNAWMVILMSCDSVEYPWDRSITTQFQEAITEPFRSTQCDPENMDKLVVFLASELCRIANATRNEEVCFLGMAWHQGHLYLMYER